jgi:hypothetical protein
MTFLLDSSSAFKLSPWQKMIDAQSIVVASPSDFFALIQFEFKSFSRKGAKTQRSRLSAQTLTQLLPSRASIKSKI